MFSETQLQNAHVTTSSSKGQRGTPKRKKKENNHRCSFHFLIVLGGGKEDVKCPTGLNRGTSMHEMYFSNEGGLSGLVVVVVDGLV
jgi:hypothetical protein